MDSQTNPVKIFLAKPREHVLMRESSKVNFRPMQEADLPLMLKWLKLIL
jgi:hypothetical protein